MENTEIALYTLLSNFVGAKKLSPQMELLHDLELAGDDAWELLEEINARFGMNFSEMAFPAYFPDETEGFGVYFAKLIGFRSSKKPLTIGHLVEVIDRGAWFEPGNV